MLVDVIARWFLDVLQVCELYVLFVGRVAQWQKYA